MSIKQIYNVENNQVVIILPEGLRGKKKLLVTLEDTVDTQTEKIELLKNAINDPLFISDIVELTEDFKFADSE